MSFLVVEDMLAIPIILSRSFSSQALHLQQLHCDNLQAVDCGTQQVGARVGADTASGFLAMLPSSSKLAYLLCPEEEQKPTEREPKKRNTPIVRQTPPEVPLPIPTACSRHWKQKRHHHVPSGVETRRVTYHLSHGTCRELLCIILRNAPCANQQSKALCGLRGIEVLLKPSAYATLPAWRFAYAQVDTLQLLLNMYAEVLDVAHLGLPRSTRAPRSSVAFQPKILRRPFEGIEEVHCQAARSDASLGAPRRGLGFRAPQSSGL